LCCDDGYEYCDEFLLKPDGEWENLTDYTAMYNIDNEDIAKDCPNLEVLERHKLNDKPTDLEVIALNALKNGISYNELDEINTIDDTIMEHIYKVEDELDYKTTLYPSDEMFDEFERKNRSKIGWELFYLADAITKYRDLGRPEPCPTTGIGLGFGIHIETKCFLTEAVNRTQDKMTDLKIKKMEMDYGERM